MVAEDRDRQTDLLGLGRRRVEQATAVERSRDDRGDAESAEETMT